MEIIDNSWCELFEQESNKDYFINLNEFLENEYKINTIYPAKENIFSAFKAVPIEKVKVVILGQDPYHQPSQAHGMAFSVPPDVKLPPSLLNIYKEINQDIGCEMSKNGNLIPWAKQGVFLLNTCLTVRESQANSHKGKGWENFSNEALSYLNRHDFPKVFMLWGRDARSKSKIITNKSHLVLEAAHPSPLSAYNGFFGCNHFKKANNYLIQNGLTPINWQN